MTTARRAATIVLALLAFVAAPAAVAQDAGETADESVAQIEELARDVANNPGDIDVLLELGNLYYEVGMLNEALATYLQVTELDSTHVGALTNLGSLYTDMGQFDNAEESLKKAVEIEPGNAMVFTNLGTNYYARRNYYDAVEMYRQALSIDPNSIEARFNLAVAFADAQIFDEAIAEWQKVIALDPDGAIAQTCRDNIEMINEYREGK